MRKQLKAAFEWYRNTGRFIGTEEYFFEYLKGLGEIPAKHPKFKNKALEFVKKDIEASPAKKKQKLLSEEQLIKGKSKIQQKVWYEGIKRLAVQEWLVKKCKEKYGK